MASKEIIERAICDAVRDVTGLVDIEKDESLIDGGLSIEPVDFLYIFDILEKKLQLPVCDIFKNHTFEVMTINNLTDALINVKS